MGQFNQFVHELCQEVKEKNLSGLDVDCLVEGLVRKGLEEILVSGWFREIGCNDGTIVIPYSETENGAQS